MPTMERKSDNLREAFGFFGDLDQSKLKTKPKKYEIEVSNSFDSILMELAKQKGLSKEEVVARALASYAYLQKEMVEGRNLVIRNDNQILQRIKLP